MYIGTQQYWWMQLFHGPFFAWCACLFGNLKIIYFNYNINSLKSFKNILKNIYFYTKNNFKKTLKNMLKCKQKPSDIAKLSPHNMDSVDQTVEIRIKLKNHTNLAVTHMPSFVSGKVKKKKHKLRKVRRGSFLKVLLLWLCLK